MKLIIETQNPQTLVVKKTVMNLTVNPFDTEGSKIPLALFTAKGDLLVGKGDGNPAALHIGSDGQVPTVDLSEPSGMKWKTMQLGTITLSNSEAFAVPSNTVVTNGTTAGTFRVATSADTTNLFVSAENILSGETGALYAVSGISCTVKVTSSAVEIGDNLTVSDSNGIAESTAGEVFFAKAIEAKSSGLSGTVLCILSNQYNEVPSSTLALFDPSTGHDHDGTDSKKISFPNIIDSPFLDNAGAHNSIYRGISLGTSVSAAQWAAIADGTFKDLYIGDYWTISGVTWRIAAFDYYYNTGDTNCTTHHVVIVPDTSLYNTVMNATNTTEGGYINSQMKTANLASAVSTIQSAFGSGHILSHRNLFVNTVTSGRPTNGSWYDSTIDLMNEVNVFGTHHFSPVGDGTNIPYNYTVDKSIFPLFIARPDLQCNRQTFWLRDVVSSANFAIADGRGNCLYYYASCSFGVRPAFCLKS